MDEDSSLEQKTWQIYSFGKRNVFRLDLNESREGFCQRGRGRSFHVDGPSTEKAQEPTAESLARGIWRLWVPEAERRVLEGLWGWRQSQRWHGALLWYIYIAESVYLVLNSLLDWEPNYASSIGLCKWPRLLQRWGVINNVTTIITLTLSQCYSLSKHGA